MQSLLKGSGKWQNQFGGKDWDKQAEVNQSAGLFPDFFIKQNLQKLKFEHLHFTVLTITYVSQKSAPSSLRAWNNKSASVSKIQLV